MQDLYEIIDKAQRATVTPDEFFNKINRERGITEAFKFAVVVGLPVTIVFLLVDLFFPAFGELIGSLGTVPDVVVYFIGLGLTFVAAGIYQLFVSWLKGRGDYAATYKATVYSSTPAALFGWIPIIGIVPSIWSLYLQIKGMSILHDISMWRALAALVLSLLAVLAVVLVGAFAFGVTLLPPT